MSQEHVTENVKRIEEIFKKAAIRIDALRLGERLPVTALAADLGKEYDLTGAQLYPIISLLVNGYPGVTVLRGAKGGIAKVDPATAKKVSEPIASSAGAISQLIEENDFEDNSLEDKTLPIINT
jgi:hypothetical protein